MNPAPECEAILAKRRPGRSWRRFISFEEQIWLVYLAFWFLQPFYDRSPLRDWLLLLGVMVSFVFFYVMALRGPRRLRYMWAFAIFVLGVVYVPINQSACGIFIFLGTTLVVILESTSLIIALLIGECIVLTGESLYFHLSPWTWSVGGGIAVLVGMNTLRRKQQSRDNARLRVAHEEIERLAKTAERERIARDMHDVLGHSLSLIVLKSELAGHLLGSNPAKAAVEISEIEATAREALAEVRRTISGYRAEGFAAELARATHMLESAGVRVHIAEMPPLFSARQEATLAMVLREAVTNIVRHAHASECSIEFLSDGAATKLVIADNGRGDIRAEGNGLRGMRERLQEVGGNLLVHSAKGTRLQIELPQSERDAEAVAL